MLEFLGSENAQMIISVALILWSSVWTLIAMWKSGKKSHKTWFVLVFLSLMGWYLYPNIVSTVLGLFAALPIFYFFIFSRFRFEKSKLVFEKWGNKDPISKK
ncbi:MAG: DUF5652 family protein [archaeon]|nr:DUF5652 family protein [archaeon]